MGDIERWYLTHDGHEHVVAIEQGAVSREVVWTRDDTELGRKKTSDEKFVVAPEGADGALRLRFGFVGPAHRVTLHGSETEAHAGLAATDFEPEPGSKAAKRAEWLSEHPHLHTARQTAIATAGVGLPILLIWLLTLIPWPSFDIPWPDLPSIPWPEINLPSIPWPEIDLPAIPWPEITLPDLPNLPGWVEPLQKFLVPILIAFFIARGEVKRRRKAQEEKAPQQKAEGAYLRSSSATADKPASTSENDVDNGESPMRRPPGSR